MRINKIIAKALIFEKEALNLGFKKEQIKFEISQNKFDNTRLLAKLNGLTFDCFGYCDEPINLDKFREEYDKMSPDGKHHFHHKNDEFIINNGEIYKFKAKDLASVLRMNNWGIPAHAN